MNIKVLKIIREMKFVIIEFNLLMLLISLIDYLMDFKFKLNDNIFEGYFYF